MKTLLVTLALALAGATSASAQIYRPSVVRDTAVLGAVAGALIGGHNDDRWVQGAVIGAAAGAVVGTAIDHSRPTRYGYSGGEIGAVAVVPNAPVIGSPAPAVVYVPSPAPRVVYVDPYPPVVVTRPIIHLSTGWGSGHRYWGRSHGHHSHYRHHVPHRGAHNRYGHRGHRHQDHRRHRR